MHVVMGASGNTGHIVATNLLARGTQSSRHRQKLSSFTGSCVERYGNIHRGRLRMPAAMGKAFDGADSAYVMIPPNITSKDPLAYSNRVSDAIARAVQGAGTKNVVALSSIGAVKTGERKRSGHRPAPSRTEAQQDRQRKRVLSALRHTSWRTRFRR